MCDPLTIAGVALTAGSVVANSVAQSNIAKARSQAMSAERERQKKLDQEAQALNTQSQDRYQDFGGQQEQKAAELADFFKSTEAGPADAMPKSSSNIVVTEGARQQASAKAFSDQQSEALANLRSFGDLLGGIGRLQARDASQIGTLGGFKRASSDLLGFELEEANKAGGNAKLFADLLGAAGSIGTTAGLSRGTYNPVSSAVAAATPAAGKGAALNPFSLY